MIFAVSNPGLEIKITPINPKITADHLVSPTFSLKKNILNNVTKIGPANVMATVSANSRLRKAIKIEAIAVAPKRLLQRWRPIFCVL